MVFLQIIEGRKRKDIFLKTPKFLFTLFQTGPIFTRFLSVDFCLFFFQFLLFLVDRQHTSDSLDMVIYSFSFWGLQEGSFWHFKSCCNRSHLTVSRASYRSRLRRSKKLNI